MPCKYCAQVGHLHYSLCVVGLADMEISFSFSHCNFAFAPSNEWICNSEKKQSFCVWQWHHMPIIPALLRLKQEDWKLKTNLFYKARPCFNKNKRQNNFFSIFILLSVPRHSSLPLHVNKSSTFTCTSSTKKNKIK